MQEDYLTKIRSVYNQFTKAEKKVADYILENPKKVLFMSISDLAEACNVGDTSVFRFCKTMNVKGYQEFKMMLSLSMRQAAPDPTAEQGQSITLQDNIEDLVKKVLAENVSAIQETYSLINLKTVSAAVDALSEAKRILFFGVGTSMLTAMKAMNKFLRIEPKVSCIMDANMQLITASTLNADDVALIFSYSGSTKDTVEIAKSAKRAGAKTILITRFQKSPLTEYADIILLCGANEGEGRNRRQELFVLSGFANGRDDGPDSCMRVAIADFKDYSANKIHKMPPKKLHVSGGTRRVFLKENSPQTPAGIAMEAPATSKGAFWNFLSASV